jgi:hypothetical protein
LPSRRPRRVGNDANHDVEAEIDGERDENTRILKMTHSAIMRYDSPKRMNLNVRKMDLGIAAVVLENGECS